ncbi:MAG: L-2-amino-thiazoline-4-carboxylic acid hydrolase [Treponema sp.]|nr:L-2-amino-thiazoline-4-carboxylic acid hydrolase [Treponema sp.]
MSNKLTEIQKLRISSYTDMAKMIRALKERFGDEVYEIVSKQNGEKALNEWKRIAEDIEDTSIEGLISCLWKPLKQEGWEYEIEKTETGTQMKCTRCGLYDLAKYCGITEEAYYMFCTNDPYITEGFNPNIGLKMTKTLMQGHDCCDHFYYYKK